METEQGNTRVNAIRDLGKRSLARVKANGLIASERITFFVEKLHADDLITYGLDTRNDVYRNLGIVPRKDFEALAERLQALETGLGDVAEKSRGHKDPAVTSKKAAAAQA